MCVGESRFGGTLDGWAALSGNRIVIVNLKLTFLKIVSNPMVTSLYQLALSEEAASPTTSLGVNIHHLCSFLH
jgi:hypothetical protein